MFAKRLLQKVTNNISAFSPSSKNARAGSVSQADLEPCVYAHYGIPPTGSVLAFDPIQRLMAIGTLDGRIKVIGGDNTEGLLISPKQLPYKYLEFLHNKGFLVAISNENDIQVWDLEHRRVTCSLHWDSNITAFSVIHGTYFMYVGDEWGLLSVLMYNAEEGKVVQLPYHIPSNSLVEAAGVLMTSQQSIVGLLPQSSASDSRVLIAYERGLIVLWDVAESQVSLARGYKDLHLRDVVIVGSPEISRAEIPDDAAKGEHEDKEVSSLCWASSDGSVLAVGYVDGDIMLWNMSCASSSKGQQNSVPSNNVVKLQLSSGNRLPVTVLHWSAYSKSDHKSGGKLFIYGGHEIGFKEVVTVLSLEWSSGIETLQCVNSADLSLDGSFSDLILVPNSAATNGLSNTLYVLTNPAQLHVCDDSILSELQSQQERKPLLSALQFPAVIPIVDPCITLTMMSLIPIGGSSSGSLIEMASVTNNCGTHNTTTWSLTDGVSCHSSSLEDNGVERLYMAGYHDGSVRIWDSTRPSLSLMFVLEGKVKNINVAGVGTSISALGFCPITLSLAVGNEYGLVCVYKFSETSGETELHIVTDTINEVNRVHQEKGFQHAAIFSILNSPVQTLQYSNSGTKLAVGFGCGRVAMLDVSSLSVLFLTDHLSGSNSPVISLTEMASLDIYNIINGQQDHQSIKPEEPIDVLCVLTKDSHVVMVDGVTGNMIWSRPVDEKKASIANSIYILGSRISPSKELEEDPQEKLTQNSPTRDVPVQSTNLTGDTTKEVTVDTSSEIRESSLDSLVLLCFEDTLELFSLKSLLKGDYNSRCKVSLPKPCRWTTTFRSKDEKVSGLALLYESGVIEIRSYPDLEVVREISLMSLLRWSFEEKMEKRIYSSDDGQISLVNGSELAFISLLAHENDTKSLHDKVLALAADEAANLSASQKKKQGISPGFLVNIIKGIKGEKQRNVEDLETIFSKAPFPDPSEALKEALELNIDDVEIDDPVQVTPIDKKAEREKLLQGATPVDIKPKLRNADEVKAKYRKTGDASAAASQARDKLVQRQEKLERVSRHTEELQDGAENFASMATELAKQMEGRKWWKR
ncbi:hypothetical protein ACHQM5_013568 [Ranunculus cassubicifolius]